MGRFPTVASAAWLSLVSFVLENISRNHTTPLAPRTCENINFILWKFSFYIVIQTVFHPDILSRGGGQTRVLEM